MSRRRKLMSACRRAALAAAILRAASEMSIAVTSACGRSSAKVMAMQPLPVPMSRTDGAGRRALAGSCLLASSMMIWQSSSVSGRGMSTAGETRKFRLQNRALPRIYCTGSPFLSRATMASRRCCSLSGKASTDPMTRSVSVKPYKSSNTRRMTACASVAA